MQNSIWKLTALAGVIGATCLVVLLIRQDTAGTPPEVTTVDADSVLGDPQESPDNPDAFANGVSDDSVPNQTEPPQDDTSLAQDDAFLPFPDDARQPGEAGIDFRDPSGKSQPTTPRGVAGNTGQSSVVPPDEFRPDEPQSAEPQSAEPQSAEPQFVSSPTAPATNARPSEPNPFELLGAEASATADSAETGGAQESDPPAQPAFPAGADTGPALIAHDEPQQTTPQREPPGLIFQAAGDRPAVAQPIPTVQTGDVSESDAGSAPGAKASAGVEPFATDNAAPATLPADPPAFQPFEDVETEADAVSDDTAKPAPPRSIPDAFPPANAVPDGQVNAPAEDFPTLDLFDDRPPAAAKPPAIKPQAPIPAKPAELPNLDTADSAAGPSIGSPDVSRESEAAAPAAEPATAAQPPAGNLDAFLGDGTITGDTVEDTLRPQLKIEKKAPSTAVLGQPLIYHILVNNVGTTTATDVVVEDRIPKGTKLTGTIPRAELIEGRLVWRLGQLQPGKQSKISVRVIPIEEGAIGSVATVTSVAEVATRTQIVAPKLKIDVNSDQRVRIGDSIVCNFTVTNQGDVGATNVWIRNVIPDGLRHPDGQDLEHKIGKLGPGASYEVQLTLQAVTAGKRVNNVSITADGGIKLTTKSIVDVQPNRLILARSGPSKRYVGRMAIYENRVTNRSSEQVTNTTLVEQLPEGMEFVEASHAGRFDQTKRTVSWDFEQLNPQESRTVSLKLLPQDTGKKTSVVQVIEASGGKTQTVSHTQITGFASLGLDVSEVNRPMAVGEQVRLTVRTRNRGTSEATNVQVQCRIPKEFELLAVTAEKRPVKFTRAGDLIKLDPIVKLPGRSQSDFEVLLRARSAARTRLQFEIVADELDQALGRDEAILIFQDQP